MDKYLTPSELSTLLKTVQRVNSPTAKRDYHIIAALSLCGCRIGEFAGITVLQAVNALKSKYLFLPREHRKGRRAHIKADGTQVPDKRKDHEVYVTTALAEHLKALLDMTDARVMDAPLVPGRYGEPMTVRAYQLRVQYWADEADLGLKVSPHWFRHTRAMNIMRSSGAQNPLLVVQKVLGHSNINNTAIYAHATREDMEQALQNVDATHNKRRGRLSALRKQHDKETA